MFFILFRITNYFSDFAILAQALKIDLHEPNL